MVSQVLFVLIGGTRHSSDLNAPIVSFSLVGVSFIILEKSNVDLLLAAGAKKTKCAGVQREIVTSRLSTKHT